MRVSIIAGDFAGLCKALQDMGNVNCCDVCWTRLPMRDRQGRWTAEVLA